MQDSICSCLSVDERRFNHHGSFAFLCSVSGSLLFVFFVFAKFATTDKEDVSKEENKVPETGDDNILSFYVALMLLAGTTVTVTNVARKRG